MNKYIIKFKLSKNEIKTFEYLKRQNIDTNDETLCYWAKSYSLKRIQEVISFAKYRQANGQNIQNIGGWIQKFLRMGLIVVNENCKVNKEFLIQFLNERGWNDLKIYEQYIRDMVTGDDLPLTLQQDDFKRCLEALYQKSLLYKDL